MSVCEVRLNVGKKSSKRFLREVEVICVCFMDRELLVKAYQPRNLERGLDEIVSDSIARGPLQLNLKKIK